MQLGLRPRRPFPDAYRGWGLVRTHGRVFALPPGVDALAALHTGTLFSRPDVISAATLDEMRVRIDRIGMGPAEGVAAAAGASGAAAAGDAVSIEFAGWLPVYQWSGDCGRHPQFQHTAAPPAGYRFTCSAPLPLPRRPEPSRRWSALRRWLGAPARLPGLLASLFGSAAGLLRAEPQVRLRDRLRVLAALVRFAAAALLRGASPGALCRFIRSRHLRSQLMLAPHRGPVFLTSMPYTFGQNPWLIEIEDPITLFYPLIQNGRTGDLRIQDSPYLPIVKTLLESDSCRAIVTHMRSTAAMVPTLFGSDVIRKKVFHNPLGVSLPARWQRHRPGRPDDKIRLLFINSWCQVPENFYVRGGLDLLEAFAVLRKRYPQLRLTLRTALPVLDAHYHRIVESGGVRLIQRFLKPREMAALHASSHVFLLPAARVHIVSLLQAMSYGLAVVASDGWGFEEYVTHERNALVVKGRYGKTSWADRDAGILREDYEQTCTPDPAVVEGVIEAVSRLVEDPQLRRRLGRTARHDVQTTYNLERWNRGLKEVFDQVLPAAPQAAGTRGPNPS